MPQCSFFEKERKRRVVAAAVLAGQRTTIIANRIGCSRRHIRQLAAEPATRCLIAEMLQPHVPALRAFIPRAITAIEEVLGATKTDKVDHMTRLRGVERLFELLRLAEGGR